MEYQSDLEVILEFLEEHYKQESGKSIWPNTWDLCAVSSTEVVETSEEKLTAGGHVNYALAQDTSQLQLSVARQVKANSSDLYTEIRPNNQESDLDGASNELHFKVLKAAARPLAQNATSEKAVKPLASITPAEKGKKLRLFHFLFEVLEDPKMAHCVSWVPATAGVFCFSARHKEQVAELWGQRKGNKTPMTYQKMSRAIRNYARSGEIFKVKKKLTYQFSPATLTTLKTQRGLKHEPYGTKRQ